MEADRPRGAVRDIEHLRRLTQANGAVLYAVRNGKVEQWLGVAVGEIVHHRKSNKASERRSSHRIACTVDGKEITCWGDDLNLEGAGSGGDYLFASRQRAEAYAATQPTVRATPVPKEDWAPVRVTPEDLQNVMRQMDSARDRMVGLGRDRALLEAIRQDRRPAGQEAEVLRAYERQYKQLSEWVNKSDWVYTGFISGPAHGKSANVVIKDDYGSVLKTSKSK